MEWVPPTASGGSALASSLRLRAGALALLLSVPTLPALAQAPLQHLGAQLSIEPRRVSLSPDRPEAKVALSLPWGAGDFRLSFIDRIMLPDGRIVAVDEAAGEPHAAEVLPRLRSARAWVAATPSTLALAASGPAADVQVKLSGPLPAAGEYRTHLTFTASGPPEPPAGAAPSTMTWAHAIPVIIRVGPADVRAAIENARVVTVNLGQGGGLLRQRALVFDLVRRGSSSLFGDLVLQGSDGASAPIAIGLAVYTEIDRRQVVHPLGAGASGMVEVRFIDRDTRPGQVAASAWVRLTPNHAEAQVRAQAPVEKALGEKAFAGAE